MRKAADNLKIPWTGTDEIRAANEIDRLRECVLNLSDAVLQEDVCKRLQTMARRAKQLLP